MSLPHVWQNRINGRQASSRWHEWYEEINDLGILLPQALSMCFSSSLELAFLIIILIKKIMRSTVHLACFKEHAGKFVEKDF